MCICETRINQSISQQMIPQNKWVIQMKEKEWLF